MGALKEGIAYLRDAISRNGKCAAVPADMVLALWEDVSDRIDAIERLTKDIAYDLEFPGKPVAQDERSCDEYELPDLYHAGVIKPKAQEQGGDDLQIKQISAEIDARIYHKAMCEALEERDDLRARLAEVEKENARLNCDLNRMWSPEAELKAHITRLEKENAELKRQLDKVKDLCPLIYNENVVCAKLYDAQKECDRLREQLKNYSKDLGV